MGWRRGWISSFLFSLAMISYVDRVALSVASKPIAEEFGLSPVTMGYLSSSFLWTYLLCLIPMGILVAWIISQIGWRGSFLVVGATLLLTMTGTPIEVASPG
jgi:sugar phosphate permease